MHRALRGSFGFVLLVVLATAALLLSAAETEIPKISTFAPSADLLGQVDFYVARVDESLADEADFPGAKQSRTVKDGATLAVLALMLAGHDDNFAQKASMPALLAASRRLATADDNFEQARGALADIKAARAGTAAPVARVATVAWEKVASLPVLMKAVPLVHTGLKRGVEPNRLKRQAAQSAGQAATLAAIAEASRLDTELAKTPADAEIWRQMCVAMRDAASEVNVAIHAQDAPRVAAAMKRLTHSCDACHAKFRHE